MLIPGIELQDLTHTVVKKATFKLNGFQLFKEYMTAVLIKELMSACYKAWLVGQAPPDLLHMRCARF